MVNVMMGQQICLGGGLECLHKIQLEEPRTIYLHCLGHSLNLAVQDTCRSIIMSDTFDTVLELYLRH